MRAVVLLAALASVVAGCSLGGGEPAAATDRCVERFMDTLEPGRFTSEQEPQLERYLRVTYCDRFAREGWVYEDGTLSIEAQHWLVGGMRCATAGAGGPSREVDCEELAVQQQGPTLDCALLHHVRRDEVQRYLRDLQGRRPLECDDGTPLDELGAG